MTQRERKSLTVSRVRSAGRHGSLGASRASPQGSLTQTVDADNATWWEFVGNGTSTGTDVVEHAIAHEASQGAETLQPLVGDRTFAQQAATSLLGTSDVPIPAGEVHEFALRDLLSLVEPFLRAYASQQQRQQQATSGSDQERAIGKVPSEGLTLPWFDL